MAEATEFEIPQTLNLKPVPVEAVSGASKMKAYALTIVVNDQSSYETAANEVALIKGRWNTLEEKRTEFVAPLNKVVKSINDFFRAPLADLAEAESTVKATMLTYRQAEEKKADEERKATAARAEKERMELERKAREERAKKEAEEQRHREEEARMAREREQSEREQREAREREIAAQRAGDVDAERVAREERENAERLRKEQEERERKARADAEKAQKEAEDRERNALAAAQAVHAAPPVQAVSVRAKGTSVKKKWKAEVTNKLDFIKAIAEGKAPLSLVDVNEGDLNRMAGAADGELNYPGVRTYPDENLSVRAK